MSSNAKIKVIKKGTKPAAQPVEAEKKSTKQAAREMVSTVTSWVSDFQQRRRVETQQAIEKLFTPTQTNGA